MSKRWALFAAAAAIVLTASAARAAERVNCSNTSNGFTCRIDEPNVRQAITEYRQIRFQPNDVVTIQAGGCVQTGGSGRTWKRYVDPTGDNSTRLYHGTVLVPGATGGAVRISTVINRPLTIPGQTPGELFLRLGYEDDNYGDNGYWGHDDGTENQCRGVGNAWATITVVRGATPPPPPPQATAPMDLVWTAIDGNWLPLNPTWAWNAQHGNQPIDAGKVCGWRFGKPCTTQDPWTNTYSPPIPYLCDADNPSGVDGHLNWMHATFTGQIFFQEHSGSDDDYNLLLAVPNNAGLTTTNEGGALLLEFDSDETIDHFSTPWWDRFHQTVDNSTGDAKRIIDARYAVATGVIGLDLVHGAGVELHPVHLLAIRVNEDPNDETWAIFVRNWGNEGMCGKDNTILPATVLAIDLPWMPGAQGYTFTQNFRTNSPQVAGPWLTTVNDQKGQPALVRVVFQLPDPTNAQGMAHGELHLSWKAAAGSGRALTAPQPQALLPNGSPRVARPPLRLARDGAEEKLERLVERMTPEQRNAYRAAQPKRPAEKHTLVPRAATGPAPAIPKPTARYKVVRDTNKTAHNKMLALCAAVKPTAATDATLAQACSRSGAAPSTTPPPAVTPSKPPPKDVDVDRRPRRPGDKTLVQ
jgi:hypothetical protein